MVEIVEHLEKITLELVTNLAPWWCQGTHPRTWPRIIDGSAI